MNATPPPTVSWESPDLATGPAPGVEYAPHGARLVAYILDGIIISIAVTVPLIVGFILLGSGTTIQGNEVTSISAGSGLGFSLMVILATAIGLLYFPFFWARGGQTLGMKPFGLRVVRDRDGGRIGWGTALLRLVGLWVAAAVLYIGFIWIFIDKRRRGWQDLIARTVVIKRP
jgi:uncharacterized RDD family membrane protein YckC